MNTLKISFEETKAVSKEIRMRSDEFKELLDKIKSANYELQTYWEGQDSSKYNNAILEQSRTMDELAFTIENISTFLFESASLYQETMEDNASRIG